MWKPRPEDNKPTTMNPTQPPFSPSSPMTAAPSFSAPAKETPRHVETPRAEVGHIGKSVMIRGELSGSEDLYLDGEIEGTVDLRDHSLIIGPNGRIKATITARDLIVHGKVEGNVTATGRVELRKSCSVVGDVSTHRIVIEDGAYFKGAIDIREAKSGKAMAASAGASSSTSVTPSSQSSFNTASASQSSL